MKKYAQNEIYAKERFSALQAQRLAHEIAFGPITFQVSRLMVKWGIFQLLSDYKKGLTLDEIAELSKKTKYGVKVLLESSLTIGTILKKENLYFLAKAGWFLNNDAMVRVNMDFNHDVNYLGMFDLEKAIDEGKPEGLKVFGNWQTIYEGLSQLPEQVQESWFNFDHYYSDNSFSQALEIVFANSPKRLLDVGGNTGRWATKCVEYNENVEVIIMDLPQQLEMMRKQTQGLKGADRIVGYPVNLLDESAAFPKGFDVIWMSQFLDCFSNEQVISILKRAAVSMNENSRLFIMENIWDRQEFETASYCLAQISLYFTAMANGNSKMFSLEDLEYCIKTAGLKIVKYHDELGLGHSIVECTL